MSSIHHGLPAVCVSVGTRAKSPSGHVFRLGAGTVDLRAAACVLLEHFRRRRDWIMAGTGHVAQHFSRSATLCAAETRSTVRRACRSVSLDGCGILSQRTLLSPLL